MTSQRDLILADGRTLHVYDTGGDADLTVVWHHGTPQLGPPPRPLLPLSAELGIRWISYDRAAYGGSTRLLGREVAQQAADTAVMADALGVERFAVMAPAGTGELRASVIGRQALEHLLRTSEWDPNSFTAADHEALTGPWGWLGEIAGQAGAQGIDGMVDDDLSYVAPWGFDVAAVRAPVLLMHGTDDRVVPAAHSQWLAQELPGAEISLKPGEGHVSVLRHSENALRRLVTVAGCS